MLLKLRGTLGAVLLVASPPFAASAVSLLLLSALSGCRPSASGAGEAGDARGARPERAGGESEGAPRRRAQHLPDFELETLGGETVALWDHLGKDVILIDFWATFCEPCLVAMPHLNSLYEKYQKDGFVILGVSIDGPTSMGRVRSEVRKAGVTFPILLDPETEALALYNPKTSAPYSVLIDRRGHIIEKKEGFSPGDVPALEAAIKAALLVR